MQTGDGQFRMFSFNFDLVEKQFYDKEVESSKFNINDKY